jgi:hypothetical protein
VFDSQPEVLAERWPIVALKDISGQEGVDDFDQLLGGPGAWIGGRGLLAHHMIADMIFDDFGDEPVESWPVSFASRARGGKNPRGRGPSTTRDTVKAPLSVSRYIRPAPRLATIPRGSPRGADRHSASFRRAPSIVEHR